MEKLVIYASGANESTIFSLYTENKKPIFTNKELDAFSNDLIREYPESCKTIAEAYDSSFATELPIEVDLSKIDSSHRNLLMVELWKKKEKIKV